MQYDTAADRCLNKNLIFRCKNTLDLHFLMHSYVTCLGLMVY